MINDLTNGRCSWERKAGGEVIGTFLPLLPGRCPGKSVSPLNQSPYLQIFYQAAVSSVVTARLSSLWSPSFQMFLRGGGGEVAASGGCYFLGSITLGFPHHLCLWCDPRGNLVGQGCCFIWLSGLWLYWWSHGFNINSTKSNVMCLPLSQSYSTLCFLSRSNLRTLLYHLGHSDFLQLNTRICWFLWRKKTKRTFLFPLPGIPVFRRKKWHSQTGRSKNWRQIFVLTPSEPLVVMWPALMPAYALRGGSRKGCSANTAAPKLHLPTTP